MISLETPIEDLPKIGPAYQKKLKKLGIHTIQDLLYYFPLRYDDFSNIININQVTQKEMACVQGRIVDIGTTKTFRKWMDITEATIEDKTGQIKALWFNQPYIEKSLKEDDFISLAGKISLGKGGLAKGDYI
jgi:ATP-dependent DNA helicase RecG